MAEVGKAEVRVDAFDKATGRTKYYEDLMPRDALYVRIKHATIAHGFVKSVDTSAAEQIPGVVKVLTCFDVPEHPFPTAGHPWSMDPGHQDVADRHLRCRWNTRSCPSCWMCKRPWSPVLPSSTRPTPTTSSSTPI